MKGPGLAAVVAAALLVCLSSCAPSANATACKLYEDAHNDLANLVIEFKADGEVTPEQARARTDAMAAHMREAYERAEGDVAVEMLRSSDLAAAMSADSGDPDVGTAFWMSTNDVQDACAAAGASIALVDFTD